MLGLLGKKMGMTQTFGENGALIPITVIEAGPCTIVQKRTKKLNGYDALQVGFGTLKERHASKAQRKYFEKNQVPLFKHLREFRVEDVEKFEVGQTLTVAAFRPGDLLDVQGLTKGRGFAGVIKRHGKHGGPASHGSDFHRRTGSIGMRTWPGRVFKNTRLPGHYGVDQVTIKNLKVVAVRPAENLLLVKGALPGARNGLVSVVNCSADFMKRDELKTVVSSKSA